MKRSVATMLAAAFLSLTSADAGEFEVFGLGLDDFSGERTDAYLSKDLGKRAPKFSSFDGVMGRSTYRNDIGIIQDLSFISDEYDMFERFGGADQAAKQQYVKMLEFSQSPNPVYPGHYDSRDIRPLKNEALNAKYDTIRRLTSAVWGGWYYCQTQSKRNRCPGELVTGDIGQIQFLKPHGAYASGALRLDVLLYNGVPLDDVQQGFEAQYPQATCSRTVAKYNRVDETWLVCKGQEEWFSSNGDVFIIQMSPDRIEELLKEPVLDAMHRINTLYNELQAETKATIEGANQARTNSMFANEN